MEDENLDSYVAAYQSSSPYALDSMLMSRYYPRRVVEKAGGGSLLELGIGHGRAVEYFSKHFDPHVVIEGSHQIIEEFRGNFPEARTRVVESFFETWETEERFEHISMGFVLEHVEDPVLILEKYAKLLEPGGRIFIAVPNANSLHRTLAHRAGMMPDIKALSEADLRLGHRRYYDVAELRAQVESVGLRELSLEGIFLKPFTTGQIKSLELPDEIFEALLDVGREYPELSNSILMEVGFHG